MPQGVNMNKKEYKYKEQGQALRNLRIQNTKYNISQVCKIFGKTRSWLSQIETGLCNVYFDDVERLCKFYGCTLNDFINEYNKLKTKKEN